MQLECMASYIAELSLLEYTMLSHSPSLVAASAIFLAKYTLDPTRRPWVCKYYFLCLTVPFLPSAPCSKKCFVSFGESEFDVATLYAVRSDGIERVCYGSSTVV